MFRKYGFLSLYLSGTLYVSITIHSIDSLMVPQQLRSRTIRSATTTTVLSSSSLYDSNIEDEFASFAATLDDNDDGRTSASLRKTSSTTSSTSRQQQSSKTTTRSTTTSSSKWKDDLDKLIFDRTTTIAQRQILISDLLNANQEIRQSVTTALRDRTIDPLLTPTGKKFQDGTRAVAYQLQTDILPSLTSAAAAAASSSNNSNNNSKRGNSGGGGNSLFPPPPVPLPDLSSLFPPIPNPEDITKFSNRFFNTVTNQIQKNMETFQSDLQTDPIRRIPERIAKQAEDILNEASNVFAETPIGLQEPPYTVVLVDENNEYEIRDYPEYTVATTTMITAINDNIDSTVDLSSTMPTTTTATTTKITSAVTDQGVAFNTLASYIFGANSENRVMEMTTPVTTTMSGEMRFYIPTTSTEGGNNEPPQPLTQDAVQSTSTNKELLAYDTTPSKIRIEKIPAARLAVRRFTGFCTAGEIQRQKDALLLAIQQNPMIEIDVPHGQTVKHILFQYNPPYTLPVIRRNEIAVPVTIVSE